jgi:hypothetical protein
MKPEEEAALGSLAVSAPFREPEVIENVLALEGELAGRMTSLVERLRRLHREPRSFEPGFKNDLQALIGRMERLSRELAGALDGAAPKGAAVLGAALMRTLEGWRKVNEALDQTVSLAIRGQLDKRFLLLSPIANCANLGERLRLQRLRERIASAAPPAAPVPTMPVPPVGSRTALLDFDLAAPELALPPTLADSPPDETLPLVPGKSAVVVLRSEDRAEQGEFDACLGRLLGADELERSEALYDVIRRYQHLLVARLFRGSGHHEPELAGILTALWRNADVLLLEDYFFSARRLKLLPLLAMAEPYPASSLFRGLLDLFHSPAPGPGPEQGLAGLAGEQPAEAETVLRAMLVHPAGEYRRFAADRLPPSRYWSVACFPEAPVASLADMLERLARPDVTDDHRKIFFDCTAKTLAAGRTEADVRAARRMLGRYFGFDFFVEDEYFRRILELNTGVERSEARFSIDNTLFKRSLEAFRKEKEGAGLRTTQLPRSFTQVPLAIQRKLAREGHYVSLFVSHPHPKIALETLRHIATPAAAEAVLLTRTANGRVVAELAKKEDLMGTYRARLALLSHPRAPLEAAQRYAPLMRIEDLRRLAAGHDASPEVGAYLRNRVGPRPS